MALRALVVWLGLVVIAIVNGAIRIGVTAPRWGAYPAYVMSCVAFIAAILAVAWLAIRWIRPATRGQALALGAAWVLLTLAFEFGAGHYAFGTPWSDLLAEYNVLRGRLWILVLIATALAPMWAARRRGLLTAA